MSIDKKKRQAAEASRRWRERHPERAKQVERDAYHRRQEREGKVSEPRASPSSEDRAKSAKARREYMREWARRWREENPEKARETAKRYYDRNAEAKRAASLEWYRKNKPKVLARLRVYHLRKRYKLTPEQYEAMGSACGICGCGKDQREGFKLAVDHDHDTGKVRGLLCGNCNTGIGLFQHNETRLKAAIKYLRRTNK